MPNSSNPKGGRFYVANSDGTSIHKYEIPINSCTEFAATYVGAIETGLKYLRDMQYDTEHDVFWGIYQDNDCPECPVLRSLKDDGTVTAEWHLPGSKQEGVAVAGCDLYIAEDFGNGGAMKRYLFMTVDNDFNCDGEVSLGDFGPLVGCAAGPGMVTALLSPTCNEKCSCAFDTDDDGYIDLWDLSRFMLQFGPKDK